MGPTLRILFSPLCQGICSPARAFTVCVFMPLDKKVFRSFFKILQTRFRFRAWLSDRGFLHCSRYWEGVSPYSSRNTRLNSEDEVNPTSIAILVMDIWVFSSSLFTLSSRTRLRYSLKFSPVALWNSRVAGGRGQEHLSRKLVERHVHARPATQNGEQAVHAAFLCGISAGGGRLKVVQKQLEQKVKLPSSRHRPTAVTVSGSTVHRTVYWNSLW